MFLDKIQTNNFAFLDKNQIKIAAKIVKIIDMSKFFFINF